MWDLETSGYLYGGFVLLLFTVYSKCSVSDISPHLDLNDAKERENPSYGHFRHTVLVVCSINLLFKPTVCEGMSRKF